MLHWSLAVSSEPNCEIYIHTIYIWSRSAIKQVLERCPGALRCTLLAKLQMLLLEADQLERHGRQVLPPGTGDISGIGVRTCARMVGWGGVQLILKSCMAFLQSVGISCTFHYVGTRRSFRGDACVKKNNHNQTDARKDDPARPTGRTRADRRINRRFANTSVSQGWRSKDNRILVNRCQNTQDKRQRVTDVNEKTDQEKKGTT